MTPDPVAALAQRMKSIIGDEDRWRPIYLAHGQDAVVDAMALAVAREAITWANEQCATDQTTTCFDFCYRPRS